MPYLIVETNSLISDTGSSGMSYIRPRLHEETYRTDYSVSHFNLRILTQKFIVETFFLWKVTKHRKGTLLIKHMTAKKEIFCLFLTCIVVSFSCRWNFVKFDSSWETFKCAKWFKTSWCEIPSHYHFPRVRRVWSILLIYAIESEIESSEFQMYPTRDDRGRSYSVRDATPDLELR